MSFCLDNDVYTVKASFYVPLAQPKKRKTHPCGVFFLFLGSQSRDFEPHELRSMTEHSSKAENASGSMLDVRRRQHTALFVVSDRRIADNQFLFLTSNEKSHLYKYIKICYTIIKNEVIPCQLGANCKNLYI